MTPFGQFLKRERLERKMTLGDLARKLKISTPYLSQIENGRRAIPANFERKIAILFDLPQTQQNEVERLAALSRQSFEIDVRGANDNDRELAHDLALAFTRLSPEGKAEIRRVIEGEST